MKKIWPVLAFALLGLCWSPAIQAAEILVSAAASLTDALTEIGKAYESNNKNRVRFNFGSSSELARQIDEGAPADIFFSADLEKMDGLEKKGRIEPVGRKNLLSNQLVLVLPNDSKMALRAPKDLLRPEVKRIALAQPETVPVGIYSKKYLESEGLWEGVAPKIIPVSDVRATLSSVESGNVDAGFVYKTDAAISKKTKAVYEVSLEKGPQIIYPVAVIKVSKNKEAAGDFLKFVSSQAGKNVFRKYGFVVLE
jgi:molybdate transport system substrate-binding protein